MQVPSYFSGPYCQIPKPNLSPFLNSPLQMEPLFQAQVPLPSGLPLEQIPSQRSPLLNSSMPWPCLYPFLMFPLYYERADLIYPCPSGLLNFHVPEQNSSPDCHLPMPCFMPLTKDPWQISPLAQMKIPFQSSGLLLTNLPMYKSPLMNSIPQPYLQLFWKAPQQNRRGLLLQMSSPQPWQRSLDVSPKQIVVVLLKRRSFPCSLRWRAESACSCSLGYLSSYWLCYSCSARTA